MPPSKTPKKATGKRPAPKKRAPARKRAAPKKRVAPKKTPRKRTPPKKRRAKPAVTAPVRTPGSRRGWILREAATWSLGVAAGLTVTAGLLWARASQDVTAYLAEPPRAHPSVVWSAPVEVRQGMAVSVPALAGDLLAAGYERVEQVTPADPPDGSAGVFRVTDQGIEVWTERWEGLGGMAPRGRSTIRIASGKVVGTSDPAGIVLRPTVLGTIGNLDERRSDVELARLSKWVEPALLSMEDQRFREHHGVDPLGVARALGRSALGGRTQGGSTLTQQLAKNLFLTSDRTLRRKVREAFFAAALEAELSKDELLELYLGEVYLGQMGGLPLHGVEQAARAWFGTSAARLPVHEAATIIGVIPAPNAYSPVRHPEVALERRNLVLRQMHSQDRLEEQALRAALAQPLVLHGLEPSRVRRAPYVVDAAVDTAEAALGEGMLASGGLHVHTTVQPLLQRAAERAVAEGLGELDENYPRAAGAQAALVAVRVSDGSVVALVGGRSYADSPFNRAMDARRQAGSTVKPLTMLMAFSDGSATPATLLADEPIRRSEGGKVWTPSNHDGQFLGEVTVRRALEGSRNIPAVNLAEAVGAIRLQRFFQDAGLRDATSLPSAALGAFPASPLEMAGAYTAMHRGVAWHPRVLQGIVRPDGQVLLELEARGDRVANERAAAQATRILQGVITSGTGARARRYGVRPPAGGKTGTTDDFRDAWFVGVTGELAVAVWVGQDQGTLGLSGSRAALPVWARFVAASGTAASPTPRPTGLVDIVLCAESGQLATDGCEDTVSDLFTTPTQPTEPCRTHGARELAVGKFFGRLFHRGDEP